MKSLLLSALLLGGAAVTQPEPSAESAADIPATEIAEVVFGAAEPVIIETGGATHTISAEIAETQEQLARGLMYRDSLADDAGMLFRYEPAQRASMWMENTLIPLDMIYIDSDGLVVKVIAHAQPQTRRSLTSDHVVVGVLELAGGQSIERGIGPGAIVRHRFFNNVETATAEDAVDETASGAVTDEP
ncbi:DUF192 domain-containing protein [Maricaulis sp.]|uniref:DUF192 domain-containing protein n=1 Tax=Maricaulis sp. TaxID=1486257 RepID=UPI0026242FD2|nr:DUF192 domain-containing protein [Maricaulis sp.]